MEHVSLTDPTRFPESDPPRTLEMMSRLHEVLGASRFGRMLLRRLPLRSLTRRWLYGAVLEEELSGPDDVTVVMGIRGRVDHRIVNALTSIRNQDYPEPLIRIAVVDYGSAAEAAAHLARICREYDADYVRVNDPGVWSRSRCLNVGIRRAETKFLLTSDADILLSRRYIASGVQILKDSPPSIVCAPMLDLPRRLTTCLRRAARGSAPLDVEGWRASSTTRFDADPHPSITMSYTAVYKLIRGYDEYYELWGAEDEDLFRRLMKLGLTPRTPGSEGFYLHQWHPKYEDLPKEGRERRIRRNRTYFRSHHSIVRNQRGWGRGGGAVLPGQGGNDRAS